MVDQVAFGNLARLALGSTDDGGDEDSQNWDEGEDLHCLGVSGKDCKGLRECEVAEGAIKKKEMMGDPPPIL